ncbi:hypothetical protein ScPMuIL_002257, partial [Solemya velum]
ITPYTTNDSSSDSILKIFNDSVQYKNSRYEVAVPWKKNCNVESLSDNENLARIMIPCLIEILIRFRRWRFALQIAVRRQDQDIHKFLWDNEGNVRVMR